MLRHSKPRQRGGYHESNRVARARKLLSEPVLCYRYTPEDTPVNMLELFVGQSYIKGRLAYKGRPHIVSADQFFVPNDLRGTKIGKHLLRAFIIEAKTAGATTFLGEEVSNDALWVLRKVLGDAAIQFYDSEEEQLGILPFRVEQAMQSNARIDSVNEQLPDYDELPHLGVIVDLRSVDTTPWNIPIEAITTRPRPQLAEV